MSNFEKDLREYSDEELYKRINTDSYELVHLYSDELTRRSNNRWSQKLTEVTILLFVVALMQLLASLGAISASWKEWLILAVISVYIISYVIKKLFKN